MNEDYRELVEYLDKKFARLSEEVANLHGEVSDIKETVTNLHGEVGDIKEKMATKVEVNKLLDAVDAYMKQGEDYRQEMLMLTHKVDRHEKWIQQIAEKLGVKLEY